MAVIERKLVIVMMVMKRKVVIAMIGVEAKMVKMAMIIHHDSGDGFSP